MTSTASCIATFIEQIVADNTAPMCPFLAETWYIADTFIVAYRAIAHIIALMPFVIEFHAMLQNENIRSICVVCRQKQQDDNHLLHDLFSICETSRTCASSVTIFSPCAGMLSTLCGKAAGKTGLISFRLLDRAYKFTLGSFETADIKPSG